MTTRKHFTPADSDNGFTLDTGEYFDVVRSPDDGGFHLLRWTRYQQSQRFESEADAIEAAEYDELKWSKPVSI